MLTIRLFRVGKKNQPAYKVVVTDKRNAASRGRFVEEVGVYNPLTKQRNLKGDRIKYWLGQGAKASDTVHNMLVGNSIIEATKIANHKKVAPKAQEAPAVAAPKAEVPAETPAETPATETQPAPEAPAQTESQAPDSAPQPEK